MRTRLALVTVLAVGVALGTTANAAPPKGFSKTVSFTDATPDPSGNTASGNEHHCDGKLPQEKPLSITIPGPGTVDVSLAGFQGDWALQVRDAKGEVLAGDDVNPPSYEATSLRLKKGTTIQILPCNLAGSPAGTVTYTYTFKK